MRGTNLEVARAALRGVSATNHAGSFQARENRFLVDASSTVWYYDYLLAWGSADGQRWFINHEPTGRTRWSNRRERDLAETNSTQKARSHIRQALIEAGYRRAEEQPEKHYERWERTDG